MKRTPDAVARMKRLAEAGALTGTIARDIGVSPASIIKWAKREGVRLMTRSEAGKRRAEDPGERSRLAELSRRGGEALKRKWGLPSIVPHWVPSDLSDDYADFAVLYGEECAASRIRRMKAEALTC
ncbi:hypothetical protein V5F32_05010 [Xanthobacter oligotrophicus]|uniref:Helix-turn-helix domain-containing protein n=1 Tax=Xanthobacter oligotrophicus TaxID=2607286 RepID=A0ABW6ZS26_9HYPH